MPLWKPLLVILPAGLALGAVGGHLARPEMQQRAVDGPWPSIFQARADREGSSSGYPAQPQDGLAYVGGYSYPPYLARTDAGWSPPAEDWASAERPLPTLAELDARQAALLADPDLEFAVHPPAQEADPAAGPAQATADGALPLTGQQPGPQSAQPRSQVASAEPTEVGPEPRKADGEPAIW